MSRLPENMTPKALNDWYELNVGYRPQEDDPSMTDAELRLLCVGVADEYDAHGEPIQFPEAIVP